MGEPDATVPIMTALAGGVGLLALMTLAYGTVLCRLGERPLLRRIGLGLMFGAGGVAAMLQSVPVAPGARWPPSWPPASLRRAGSRSAAPVCFPA